MNFTKADIPRQVVPCCSDFPASRVGAAKDTRLFYTTEQANLQTAPDHTPGSAACQLHTRDNLQESLKPKHNKFFKRRARQKEPFGSAVFRSPSFLVLFLQTGKRMGERGPGLGQHD